MPRTGKAVRMRPGPGEEEVRAAERIDDPRAADAKVLEHLERLGCDPAEPREVRHFFYAEHRGDAESPAKCAPPSSSPWSTASRKFATFFSPPTSRSSTSVARLPIRLTLFMPRG